jgi:ABC-type nitrate/sulfonate/bicarbonate transport system substrate-binding protein
MRAQHTDGWTRRRFIGRLTVAGAVGLLGLHAKPAAAEPTRLRLAHNPGICIAPYFLAKEFLPAQGFTDVQDVRTESTVSFKAVVAREIDIAMNFSGPLITRTTMDRPWSQYFCCMAYAHREFVRTHPVAIKRALRAFLKAAAVCSLEPERVARFLVDGGYTRTYEYALRP